MRNERRAYRREFVLVIPVERLNDTLWEMDIQGLLHPTQVITGSPDLHVKLGQKFSSGRGSTPTNNRRRASSCAYGACKVVNKEAAYPRGRTHARGDVLVPTHSQSSGAAVPKWCLDPTSAGGCLAARKRRYYRPSTLAIVPKKNLENGFAARLP